MDREEAYLKAILEGIEQIELGIARILRRLQGKAVRIVFLVRFKGKTDGGNAMVNLDPTNNAYDIVITGELDANGSPVTLPTIAFGFAVDDPSHGIFTVNADGKSGTLVAPKTATASFSGIVTMTDPVVGITAQSHFTLTVPPPPPPPPAATIQFTESAPHPSV